MKYYNQIDLQLFSAQEKTEKPTPKKRKEAREKGQITQSRELTSALILLFAFISMRIFGKYILSNISEFTNSMLSDLTISSQFYSKNNIIIFFMNVIIITIKIVLPIVATVFLIALVTTYLQVGFLFTTKTLKMKLSRINPIEGFKRMFSTKSLVELFKSLVKVFLIGYIIYLYLLDKIQNIYKLFDMSIEEIVRNIGNLSFGIAIRAGSILLVLSIFDYWYQWWQQEKNLKMSKQEVKEENKQTEGDPMIKSKIKEKQRQIAARRMMQDVPKADVIITNPTHFAVAIKYDDKYDAPYVIAKGQDLIAQKIKEIANDSSVTIVENKLLARSLFSQCEIGQVIPEELYQSVAEVLAYVYSLNG